MHAERLDQDILKARIDDEFQAAIYDAEPVNCDTIQQLAPAGAYSNWINWLFDLGKVDVYLLTQNSR